MTLTHIAPHTEEWQPKTDSEKLDRLDSLSQIKQLPARYALAVDTRNIDELVELFVPDVQIGKNDSGRDKLHDWMSQTLADLDRTIHLVANHVISFEDADHASGVVYCRDEVESKGQWTLGHLQYWDKYERRSDGRWYIVRRRYTRWSVQDNVTRKEVDYNNQGLTTTVIPQAWPSWNQFWEKHGAQE